MQRRTAPLATVMLSCVSISSWSCIALFDDLERPCPCAKRWVCCANDICAPTQNECPPCVDFDGDGFVGVGQDCPMAVDCNDRDAAIHPHAFEGQVGSPSCTDTVAGVEVDNDCNGLANSAEPACTITTIFRSVTPSGLSVRALVRGDDIELSSGAALAQLRVEQGVGHFATALPGHVGTGDLIDVGDDETPLYLVIARRWSDRTLQLHDLDGQPPTDAGAIGSGWKIHRAYIGLGSAMRHPERPPAIELGDKWRAHRDNHLFSFTLYRDHESEDGARRPFVHRFTTEEWARDAPQRLVNPCVALRSAHESYEVGESQRHRGYRDRDRVLLSPANGRTALRFTISCGHAEGLQIEATQPADPASLFDGSRGIYFDGGSRSTFRGIISHNILWRNRTTGGARVVQAARAGIATTLAGRSSPVGHNIRIINNVVLGFDQGIYISIFLDTADHPNSAFDIYNNSLIGAPEAALVLHGIQGLARLKNNLMQDCWTPGSSVSVCTMCGFDSPPASRCVLITGGADKRLLERNVIDQDDTLSVYEGLIGQQVLFAAGREFGLASDNTAPVLGGAADLSTECSPTGAKPSVVSPCVRLLATDIDGQQRQAPWDIGADQLDQ